MATGNLVNYSSSSSSCGSEDEAGLEEDECTPSSKRARTLSVSDSEHARHVTISEPADKESFPLPAAILNMFSGDFIPTSTHPPTSDPPQLCSDDEHQGNHGDHGGRVRSFPHIRGNWPTFVHIPFSLGEHDLEQCVASYHHSLVSILPQLVDCGVLHMVDPADVHISLSRTLPIRHHWIQPLVGSIKSRIASHKRFVLSFSVPEVYSNDEKTRSFIGLKVSKGHNNLCALVSDMDECYGKFGLKSYYKDPIFHISVFWCLGNILPKMSDSCTIAIQEAWRKVMSEHKVDQSDCYEIADVRCKTGNKLFTFSLS